MECALCARPAVIDRPARCREHFLSEFERKVKRTIAEHSLIPAGSRIAVAVSGGKDSLTVLTLLRRWYPDVTAIAIDEGIAGYRDATLARVRAICVERNIPLIVRSFEELCGMTLDEVLRTRRLRPCTVCGALRRHLLNIAAKGFDVLATGHNADDEAQAVLMNIIKGNTELFGRQGPATSQPANGFVRRIKPLYLCTEKEVMTYAYLQGLMRDQTRGPASDGQDAPFSECPYVGRSYRRLIRDELNRYAQSRPGAKLRILERFLAARQAFPAGTATLPACERCGEPTSVSPCRACGYVELLQISSEQPR